MTKIDKKFQEMEKLHAKKNNVPGSKMAQLDLNKNFEILGPKHATNQKFRPLALKTKP